MKTYLVGGCVRDQLLGRPVVDRDWVVAGATPAQMLEQGFQQVGKDFPVFLHPQTREEYALARTERKSGKGYYGFECNFDPSVTLEEDLQRRDLTINAIAQDTDGNIIDPYGGQNDLKNKVLRHVSNAFLEDPVRILRVARFAARFAPLGFTIAPETIKLMQQMVDNGEIDELVPERVWQEMSRALQEDMPEVFFTTLRDCDALEVIFPQLDRLWGVPQKAEYHPEIDTGIHVMMALQQAVKFTNKPEIRFAVLCHDLGKGVTPGHLLPSHHGHEERGVELIRSWCNKYRVPNNFKDLAIKVSRWHLHAHKVKELRPETLIKLFQGLDAFRNPVMLQDYLIACKADATGRAGKQDTLYPNAEFLQQAYVAACDIDVAELMAKGLEGAKLGEAILKARARSIKQVLRSSN